MRTRTVRPRGQVRRASVYPILWQEAQKTQHFLARGLTPGAIHPDPRQVRIQRKQVYLPIHRRRDELDILTVRQRGVMRERDGCDHRRRSLSGRPTGYHRGVDVRLATQTPLQE